MKNPKHSCVYSNEEDIEYRKDSSILHGLWDNDYIAEISDNQSVALSKSTCKLKDRGRSSVKI